MYPYIRVCYTYNTHGIVGLAEKVERMEGRKESGSSSPSLTSQLFGSRDNPPPPSFSYSSWIFGSIFAPPLKVMG
ncbi:unnamed protein product [Brassica rapa subsp. trilocularis]